MRLVLPWPRAGGDRREIRVSKSRARPTRRRRLSRHVLAMLRLTSGRLAASGLLAGGGLLAAAALWSRAQRKWHGVVVSFYKYARMRYLLRDPSKVLVIADFDRTITTCAQSSHGVIESCKELSAEYRAATTALFKHYYPIETSTLTREEKIPLMTEWYEKAHALLAAEPLSRAVLERAARDSKVQLREGFVPLLDSMDALDVPLVVCSAGVGDVIRAILRCRLPAGAARRADSAPVVSNWLRFSEGGDGCVCGFSQPLLHMFNKDGTFIRAQLGDEWQRLSHGRSVVVVVGDGLGDATMAEGLGFSHVVRVGYLNDTDPARVAERLPLYQVGSARTHPTRRQHARRACIFTATRRHSHRRRSTQWCWATPLWIGSTGCSLRDESCA